MFFKFLNILKDNNLYLNYKQNRYKTIINKLKTKDKISVIFLINHISQWKYQTLFNLFNKSKKYVPFVIFIPDDNHSNSYLDGYIFNKSEFKKNNIQLISSFVDSNNSWQNLDKIYKPDIVFFF